MWGYMHEKISRTWEKLHFSRRKTQAPAVRRGFTAAVNKDKAVAAISDCIQYRSFSTLLLNNSTNQSTTKPRCRYPAKEYVRGISSGNPQSKTTAYVSQSTVTGDLRLILASISSTFHVLYTAPLSRLNAWTPVFRFVADLSYTAQQNRSMHACTCRSTTDRNGGVLVLVKLSSGPPKRCRWDTAAADCSVSFIAMCACCTAARAVVVRAFQWYFSPLSPAGDSHKTSSVQFPMYIRERCSNLG